MELILLKKSMEEMRDQAREVARWLAKDGLLIFDDEPQKAYQAKVYENIDIDEIAAYGRANVVFECQPFAESLSYNQVYRPEVNSNGASIPVEVQGTQGSCCIITIKNTGTSNINGISIIRKVVI